MSNPKVVLTQRFRSALDEAFNEDAQGVDPAIAASDRADYQANVAMGLAKRLGKNPRTIAAAIVDKLHLDDVCDDVSIAGPGFINLTLKREFLEQEVSALARDKRLGVLPAANPKKIVVEYSGVTVGKEMHVGHLRTTIIGDALARINDFLGHRVIRLNHIGDWGTPFGLVIQYLNEHPEIEWRRNPNNPDAVDQSPMNDLYKLSRKAFDEDPAFANRARLRVVALQAGDPETTELWSSIIDESMRSFNEVYERLGVLLTDEDIAGESFYNAQLAGIAEELELSHIAVLSEGALCVFSDGVLGPDGKPTPQIVRKSDGGFGYAATDLAALRHRVETLRADEILYVVDARQSLHFRQVFDTARRAGWLPDTVEASHISYGMILGTDGKPYKSRSGKSVRLTSLLDEAVEHARETILSKGEIPEPDALDELARKVGIGAIKYADLSTSRTSDYVFDPVRMVSLKGNTAPYLQYAHARIRSIFRRAKLPVPLDARISLEHPAERALAREILSFPSALEVTARLHEPHRLCTYLYDLATAFTTFYDNCSVLKAEDATVRDSRLLLCDLSARVLSQGLGLLGIDAPERMGGRRSISDDRSLSFSDSAVKR
ncbi:MAG TPA: arginine--tRNA ligase [Candidatus Baltobacteraceae bacterium]|jgi:arginyl-tRNA synthetase|nr:arginine--tRNA ligase [Candidatus Baltobacteraceae bacterium]